MEKKKKKKKYTLVMFKFNYIIYINIIITKDIQFPVYSINWIWFKLKEYCFTI